MNPQEDRYPLKTNPNSSHSQIRKLLTQYGVRSVIDVGCSNGKLLSDFAKANLVVGVETNFEDVLTARDNGYKVFFGSWEDSFLLQNKEEIFNYLKVVGKKHRMVYDAVVFADVLEHLVDPSLALEKSSDFIDKNSIVLISVPNFAHLSVRLQLLIGKFDYTERGILDRTHLKFFTRKSLMKLIETSNFTIEEMRYTPTPVEIVFPEVTDKFIGKALLSLVNFLTKIRPTIFAYQFICVLRLA